MAAFFIAGITRSALGDAAGWFVLAAAILAAFARVTLALGAGVGAGLQTRPL